MVAMLGIFDNYIMKSHDAANKSKKLYLLSTTQHWYNANRLAFRYWKMSCVVMVITSEHIEFITSGRRPRVINSMCHA